MKTYIIIPVKELTESIINASLNDVDTLRLSVDGTKAVLKFPSKYPDCVAGYEKYDTDAILNIMAGVEWTVAE